MKDDELIVFWTCSDPDKYPFGREYKSERAAMSGANLRDEYVVKVSYSLCTVDVIKKPKGEDQ